VYRTTTFQTTTTTAMICTLNNYVCVITGRCMTTTRQFEFLTMSSGTYDVWRDTTSSPRECIVTSSWRHRVLGSGGSARNKRRPACISTRRENSPTALRRVQCHSTPRQRVASIDELIAVSSCVRDSPPLHQPRQHQQQQVARYCRLIESKFCVPLDSG